MAKDGQAKVLSDAEYSNLLEQIRKHRHPEKNNLIMQISFKLGLRVQEISLLQIKHVAELGSQYPGGFEAKDMLVLPKSLTKGARTTAANTKEPQRTRISFRVEDFNEVVEIIARKAKQGKEVYPEDYYPALKKASGGKTRELPMGDSELQKAISEYLVLRLSMKKTLKMSHPLVISQKGGKYSPNTLQGHMSTMLKQWACVKRASSHSGRRTLGTKLLHDQGEHIKTVQQILGHKDAATTIIYHDVPEEELKVVMKKLGKSYNK